MTESLAMLTSDSEMLTADRVERQIRKDLAKILINGVNTKLPQERVLAQKYKVSRTTIREVLRRLKRDNLVSSVWGKGTFVIPAPRTPKGDILLVCENPHHIYNMMAIGTVSSLLQQHDCVSNVVASRDSVSDWKPILSARPDARGVILIGAFRRNQIKALVEQCNLPLVHIGDLSEGIRGPAVCDNVLNDCIAQAFRATDHLIRQGHRNIVWLTCDADQVWLHEMFKGYTDALRFHGIESVEDFIIPIPENMSGEELHRQILSLGRAKAKSWASGGAFPTALIHSSASESWVRDIVHCCFRDFIRDEAIVAITYSEYLNTNFVGMRDSVAVCVRFEDLAQRALELLLRPRRGDEMPRREIIEQTHFYRRRYGIWYVEE